MQVPATVCKRHRRACRNSSPRCLAVASWQLPVAGRETPGRYEFGARVQRPGAELLMEKPLTVLPLSSGPSGTPFAFG